MFEVETPRFLKFSTSTSRGRDTYGYNIITLTDTKTGRKYKTCGGGYDMVGTVLADWVGDVLQEPLKKLLTSQGFEPGGYAGGYDSAKEAGRQYGAGISKKGVAYMDGACGRSTVQVLLRMLGYDCVDFGYTDKKGHYQFQGFMIHDMQSEGCD